MRKPRVREVCDFSKVPPLGTDIRQFGSKVRDSYHKALLPFCGKESMQSRFHSIHQGLGRGSEGEIQDPCRTRTEALGEL